MVEKAPILKALVLQGGGALGAFALGALKVLYGERDYRPDLISGVSIGAITAALLARPKNGDPLRTLEMFWEAVTVEAAWWPEAFQRYASAYGNPKFFTLRNDLWAAAGWTSLYSTAPLKATLEGFVDLEALADPAARPRLVVTATDVEAGEIRPFDSADGGMTLEHILASGSLPPSFPATQVGKASYWDGGLFDNTPLGEVLSRLSRTPAAGDLEVVVINLFANKGAIPTNFGEVNQRMTDLMFANKTESDLKLLERFNAVSVLLEHVRTDERWKELAASDLFKEADRNYVEVPEVRAITRTGATVNGAWSDFSRAGIAALAAEGGAAARQELARPRITGGKPRGR